MSRSRQVIVNTISQWGLVLLNGVVGVLLVPFLLRHLGQDGYGLMGAIMAVVGMCLLADMGVSSALARCLAEAQTKKNEEEYRQLLVTGFAICAVVGGVAACAVFLSAPYLAKTLNVSSEMYPHAVFLFRVYGSVHLLSTLLGSSARAILQSHHRFDKESHIVAIRQLLTGLLLFAVLRLTSAGLEGWAIIAVVVDLFSLFASWWMASRIHVGLCLSIRDFRFEKFLKVYGLGSQMAALRLSAELSINTDPFILTHHLGPSSVSYYNPPRRIMALANPLVMNLSSQLVPLATKSFVQNNQNDLQQILLRGTKYTMILGAIAFSLIFSFAYPICYNWLEADIGNGYMLCANILMIQALTQFAVFSSGTQWTILIGMRQLKVLLIGRIFLSFINIIISWILVGFTSLKLYGVVIPTLVIEWFWRPVLAVIVCQKVNLSIWTYFRYAHAKPFIISTILVSLGLGLQYFVNLNSLWKLGLAVIIMLTVACVILWVYGIDTRDRNNVKKAINLLFNKLHFKH